MNRKHIAKSFLFVLILSVLLVAVASGQTRFKVSVDPSLALKQPVSGRLLIFMRKSDKPLESVEPDLFDPNAVWIAGREIAAGGAIEIDADTVAFPTPFSSAPAGEYQVMAVLDRNHSYTYFGYAGAGDLVSAVQKVTMPASETSLTFSRIVTEKDRGSHPNAKMVEFESPKLSAFWGRPIKMQAAVMLPASYFTSGKKTYPTAYIIHGYGGGAAPPNVPQAAETALKQMKDGSLPEMIYVFLNAHNSLGHHVFADSVNNGPWGTALVTEFIPYLEKQFRIDARPSSRFLTGHSSGGWSTLWVMVSHPDFFGGTWSTSPDPVSFRNFTGPDIYAPGANAYHDAAGKEYGLVRVGGRDVETVRQYTQQENVLGEYGGQFGSFNAVFSPKGDDGRPMKLFDVGSGAIDPFVANEWAHYDISRILHDNWKTLGPKLKGKLHIVVGTADTFHLDEPTRLLDAELKELGSDAKFEYLDGRTHFDLYQGGLRNRMFREMYAVARPAAKTKVAGK